MVEAFDRIVIEVPDIDAAVAQYRQLTGVESHIRPTAAGISTAWLGLPNAVLELRSGRVDQARIAGLVFSGSWENAVDSALPNPLQLELYGSNGQATAEFRRDHGSACSSAFRVDHLVLRTGNAQACVQLFERELGIRLALDQTVPEWGGRMLFFRAGQLTLEVIESATDSDAADYFWGVALQCPDLAGAVSKIRGRGVTVSDIREGRKAGTRVATVKSHCLGIPTLLIGPAT